MKKIVYAVVVASLLLCFSVPAYAAQTDITGLEACVHVWGPETVSDIWSSHNNAQCEHRVVTTKKVCKKCGEVNQVTNSVDYPYHTDELSQATCDGTMQTHVYSCGNCGAYRYTRWVACPGANQDHSSGCQWLPV